ncbi:MAG: hypothetical protein ACI9VM_000945 [Candidatus Azotimanducaceae bacterium]|jgi:hypothetical protein
MDYKGVVHMHSTYSYDAKVSLPDLKQLLVSEGISFACMTEHTNEMTPESAAAFVTECRSLSDESFVFVPGFEVPYKDPKVFHVLMIGATEFISSFAQEAELRAWAEVSSLVVIAHPVRNKFFLDDTLKEVIDGVEIWNQQYDGARVPRIQSYRLLESLREEKPKLLATGALDFHRVEHLTYPRYDMTLQELTEEAIITALKKGDCTFGNSNHSISPKGTWSGAGKLSVRMTSFLSTQIIYLSKRISKILAKLGLSFPKSVKRVIRTRV